MQLERKKEGHRRWKRTELAPIAVTGPGVHEPEEECVEVRCSRCGQYPKGKGCSFQSLRQVNSSQMVKERTPYRNTALTALCFDLLIAELV